VVEAVMATFRRVEANRAGSGALGILVPPGPRTLVILRPRALEWDLLPIRFEGGMSSDFCAFERDEAAVVARQVQRALEETAETGECPVQVVVNPGGDGFLVWVPMLDVMWMLCLRVPGRPYEPCVFASRAEAQSAVERMATYLWPAQDAGQEYYFNTQNFSQAALGRG
jgi:hypothetical protein